MFSTRLSNAHPGNRLVSRDEKAVVASSPCLPFGRAQRQDAAASSGPVPDGALLQVYFGLVQAAPPSRFVKNCKFLVPGKLLRFGQQVRLPRERTYETVPPLDPASRLPAIRISAGDPDVLGATVLPDRQGVNFAVAAKGADSVELCLFDKPDPNRGVYQEVYKISLQKTGDVWHGFSPDLKQDQVYGYRASGPYDPVRGQRYNANKVLLDPYAKAIVREQATWDPSLLGYHNDSPNDATRKSLSDSAAYAPLGAVIEGDFDWEGDRRLQIPWEDTVIYEAHVKGMTALHPLVPAEKRGTYAGLADPSVIEHLKKLGVTAVEVLPVHHFLNDQAHKGLNQYWGYQTLGFFTPHPAYASERSSPEAPVREFKEMVKKLHENGLEVILDVVYNHTAEGNEKGPTLSLRGLDNSEYYRLVRDQPQYYKNYSGCGNTLDTMNPQVIRLILDSLRYWVEEMHVDGFRFDLASALARLGPKDNDDIPKNILEHPLFKAIQDDPVLSRVKLIAEPWDAHYGSVRIGKYPPSWSDWNGHYRDDVRAFWRGDKGTLSAFVNRLTGSQDPYGGLGKSPRNSVNFVTAHDGFTMRDLVSYNHKHNDTNREGDNGENKNYSMNHGVEGPTHDPAILALRKRHVKNLLATLFLSQGVPMLLHGDETGRTQNGNNNVYCQDNETAYMHWGETEVEREIQAFTRQMIRLRKEHPIFRRSGFINKKEFGINRNGVPLKAATWYHDSGREMRDSDWLISHNQSVGVLYDGNDPDLSARDDHFLLLMNASDHEVRFHLPAHPDDGGQWAQVFDTFDSGPKPADALKAGQPYPLGPRSFVVLKMRNRSA